MNTSTSSAAILFGRNACACLMMLLLLLLVSQSSSATGRVTQGVVAAYDFAAGDGATVADVSGVEPLIDLSIDDVTKVQWQECGGLTVSEATLISNGLPATKMIEQISASGEITLEAWITPANDSQAGPARIMTLSDGATERNFTLGQNGWNFQTRLRTTTAGLNGTDIYTETAPEAGAFLSVTEPSHVVYTRSSDGLAKLYLDGNLRVSQIVDGDFSNWDSTMQFGLANEFGADRNWLGTYQYVSVYDRALTSEEVQQNFQADAIQGCDHKPLARFSMNQTIGEANLDVLFDAGASSDFEGSLVSYSWDFGDGSTSTGLSVNHTYVAEGDYFPSLTVTDGAGQVATQTRYVKVMKPGTYTRISREPDLLYTFSESQGSVIHN